MCIIFYFSLYFCSSIYRLIKFWPWSEQNSAAIRPNSEVDQIVVRFWPIYGYNRAKFWSKSDHSPIRLRCGSSGRTTSDYNSIRFRSQFDRNPIAIERRQPSIRLRGWARGLGYNFNHRRCQKFQPTNDRQRHRHSRKRHLKYSDSIKNLECLLSYRASFWLGKILL